MKTYENRRLVGIDYFILFYRRTSNKSLKYFLDQFNVDEYIIFKSTNKFRQLTYNELIEEKYTFYLFIRNDIYDQENNMLWFDWIKNNITIQYLNKPFPNFNPYEKIIELH